MGSINGGQNPYLLGPQWPIAANHQPTAEFSFDDASYTQAILQTALSQAQGANPFGVSVELAAFNQIDLFEMVLGVQQMLELPDTAIEPMALDLVEEFTSQTGLSEDQTVNMGFSSFFNQLSTPGHAATGLPLTALFGQQGLLYDSLQTVAPDFLNATSFVLSDATDVGRALLTGEITYPVDGTPFLDYAAGLLEDYPDFKVYGDSFTYYLAESIAIQDQKSGSADMAPNLEAAFHRAEIQENLETHVGNVNSASSDLGIGDVGLPSSSEVGETPPAPETYNKLNDVKGYAAFVTELYEKGSLDDQALNMLHEAAAGFGIDVNSEAWVYNQEDLKRVAGAAYDVLDNSQTIPEEYEALAEANKDNKPSAAEGGGASASTEKAEEKETDKTDSVAHDGAVAKEAKKDDEVPPATGEKGPDDPPASSGVRRA